LFTDCYCTQFRRSARALTRLYDAALKDHGIRITQFSLLRALERLGAATISELAEEIVVDKTTMSRNVKLLSGAGWVTYEATEDLREKRFRLSPAGKEKLKESTESWCVAQGQILESAKYVFSSTTDDPLIQTLEKLQALSAATNLVDEKG
jgi:DNA-binding MarR family transcriptional regulator